MWIPTEPPADLKKIGSRLIFGGVSYPRSLYAFSALSQCCQQTRRELKEFSMASTLVKTTTSELDVLFQDGALFPTWTLLPCPTTQRMQQLKVKLRLRNVTDGSVHFWGDGGLGTAFAQLFSLFNALLHCGPGFFYRGAENEIFIEVLTINVFFEYDESVDPKYLQAEADEQTGT